MSLSSVPEATVAARTRERDRIRETVRTRGAELNGQARAAGDELARLAAAADSPGESDRLLADAWSRLTRLRNALRLQREALAIERRRTRALRAELRRMREKLAELRAARSGSRADETLRRHRRP